MERPRAFVASDDGVTFAAHVAYDVPGPFCFCNGPVGEAALAVGWSRAHAKTVLVRVGSEMFSAGQVPIPGIERWEGPASQWRATDAKDRRHWRVLAQTSVHPPKLLPTVAMPIRHSLDAVETTRDVDISARDGMMTISFCMEAGDELQAHAAAFHVLSEAWKHARFETEPSYDASSISVHEL